VHAAKEGMCTYYVTTLQEYVKMTQIIYFGTVIISLEKVTGFSLIKSPTNNLLIVNINYISRFDYPVNKHSINLRVRICIVCSIWYTGQLLVSLRYGDLNRDETRLIVVVV